LCVGLEGVDGYFWSLRTKISTTCTETVSFESWQAHRRIPAVCAQESKGFRIISAVCEINNPKSY